MSIAGPAADDSARIRKSVDAVLADPAFKRSPVLSRLLAYLAEMTLQDAAINSYTIAIDGLGRSDRNLSEADTYARVAVARLRKALSIHHGANPAQDELQIETGSYAVRIRSMTEPPAMAPVPEQAQAQRRQTLARPLAVLSAVAILLIGAASYLAIGRNEQKWAAFDLPRIAVETAGSGTGAGEEYHRQALMNALNGYAGLRLVEKPAQPPDYRVRITPPPAGSPQGGSITLVETKSGRVLWVDSHAAGSEEDLQQSAVRAAAIIASPSGVLHSFARRAGYTVQSPYGCWLRFTEGVQTYNTFGDRELATCARNWYAVSPGRPLAAFLHGWAITDSSVNQIGAARRRETVTQALDIIHRAQVLNPDFAVLHIAEMRAYSFIGNRSETLVAAREAIADARGNRLVVGMAASGLALWNEPEGEIILRDLHRGENPPFPWEHVGLFIAAMMKDDAIGAGSHLGHLEDFQSGQPLLLLLKAAHAARTGDDLAAGVARARLNADPRIRIVGADQLVDRLPMAPEVRARLKTWLAGSGSARTKA